MRIKHLIAQATAVALLSLVAHGAFAACSSVPTRAQLQTAVTTALAERATFSKGLQNEMWVTLVDGTGTVCVVLNTKGDGLQNSSVWALSRVISAQKAYTSAGLSINGQPWSTAMLYAATQPGGFLFGLQHSNPLDATQLYTGSNFDYGTANDPLVNKRVGGVNVFGGGLGLYLSSSKIGAIGVSGDTSCTDHAFAWRVRLALNDAGLADATAGDEMTYDDTTTTTVDGHPRCLGAASDPVVDASETGIVDPNGA